MHKGSTKAPTQRQLKVGEEIRHVLADIFERGEIRDPAVRGIPITVSEVRISPNLKSATAFVMPLGGNVQQAQDVVEALTRARPFFRRCVAKAIQLRYTPEIEFCVDDSFEHARRIDQLLRETGTPSAATSESSPASPSFPGTGEDHGA